MNIAIAAPKGGVGSSTFAVLLARQRADRSAILLIDGACDPSLDLYTGTAHQILPEFTGKLSECMIPLEEMGRTQLAVVDPARLIGLDLSKEMNKSGSDLIIDVGTPDDEVIAFLAANDIPMILVLTQDNAVLRAADSLLGTLRRSGVRCGFIVSFHEDRDPQELADLDELFGLLEEDFYGVIPRSEDLRIQMNQGKPGQVSQIVREAVRSISDTIETAVASEHVDPAESGKSFTIPLSEEPSGQGMALSEIDEADPDQTADWREGDDRPEKTDGVFFKIKQFFQNFGKGN